MSTIYTARDRATREQCVLKVLPLSRVSEASYLPRFQREARVACGLHHPNVVRVFGLHCESDGESDVHFMAMEWLHGENLSDKVKREGPLPLRLAAELTRQAAHGLAYAHQAGLVHRDVKPANFVLTTDGTVKVLDLGLAGVLRTDDNDLTRQYDERVLGTADYLSPEQAVDSHTVDARADIYSLGCMLYFLLTGRPPFPDGNLAQRILAHQTQQPPSATEQRSDVAHEFQIILEGMMEKSRDTRTQTADLVATQLADWLESTIGDKRFDQVPQQSVADTDESRSVDLSAATTTQTDTVPLERESSNTVEDSCAESGVYTPEFESFLRQLDKESGLRIVVVDAALDQELRSMGHLRPKDPSA